jgi:transcriptional regulator with XRE-family HTH domain
MTDANDNVDEEGSNSLGAFIRAQREMANLSLRQLSNLTKISNAYLSQIERNLHEPSIKVLRNVGDALGIRPERLMTLAGLVPSENQDGVETPPVSTEDAILADPYISAEEKNALLSVYRSYRAAKP